MKTSEMARHLKGAVYSISALWVGTIAGAGLAFATQVILARFLGVEQFGAFSAALSTVNLFAPLAGFGVANYWLNVFGQEGWQAQRWISGSIRFLAVSTSLVVVAVLVWAWLGPHSMTIAVVLSILVAHILGQAANEFIVAKYQLEGRYRNLANWQITPNVLRFSGVVLIAFVMGRGNLEAWHVALSFAASGSVIAMVGLYHLHTIMQGRLLLDGHGAPSAMLDVSMGERPGPLAVASFSWPFGLAGIFYLIYFQSDIVLVKYLVGEEAAGIYNVAFLVIGAVYLLPSAATQKFLLPQLHRWAHHDVDKFYQAYRIGNRFMFVAGVVATGMLWTLAPVLLPWLFGDAYRRAIVLVMILASAIPFRFLALSSGAVLATRDYMPMKVRLMGVAALLNLMLNLILIPQLGAIGSAGATVITEAVIMVLYTWCCHRILGRRSD